MGSQANHKKAGSLVPRPNYFIAIQISNPEIHQNVVKVQEAILSSNELLAGALTDVARLHITILVLHIENDEQLDLACSALDHCGAILGEWLSEEPLLLTFANLSHFSNQTVFAEISDPIQVERLIKLSDRIREVFSTTGLSFPDSRPLNPHLTIAKTSKLSKKGKDGGKIRKIHRKHYETVESLEFGTQLITSLQLLSMNKKGDPATRYYHKCREYNLDVTPMESKDHTKCCFPRRPLDLISLQQKRKLSTLSGATYAEENFLRRIWWGSFRALNPSLFLSRVYNSGLAAVPRSLHPGRYRIGSGSIISKAFLGMAAVGTAAFIASRLFRKKLR